MSNYIEDNSDVNENDIIEALKEEARLKRNALLAETDVWGLSDFPATKEQIIYRQELRDITEQTGFPENIDWPQKPEQ